jgi:hypothetical protein
MKILVFFNLGLAVKCLPIRFMTCVDSQMNVSNAEFNSLSDGTNFTRGHASETVVFYHDISLLTLFW